MTRLFQLAAALAAALAFSSAQAHTVDKGLATVHVDGPSVHYHLLLAVSQAGAQGADGVDLGPADAAPDYSPLQALVPRQIEIRSNGQACTPDNASLTPPANAGALVAVDVRFTCPQPPRTLEIRDRLPALMPAHYHTIASVQWPGGSQPFVFTREAPELRVELAEGGAPRSAGSFFLLGIEHILIGWDHLLFLLALILGGGSLWSLFKIVSAFTLAHSITLALAALQVVTLPEQLVEAAIALSIAYVAAENLFLRKTASHRWAVSFLFGLVHGFGFSNVLRELGLPRQGLVAALLNFNLGVEVGQALAVLAALPVLFWLRRIRWEPRARMAASGMALAVGIGLFVERAAFVG